ncbi:MAG: hypothetical protein [Circular genetic element sp.]|nr:MAG: hypothetical protein [Circular genetic element sp.]
MARFYHNLQLLCIQSSRFCFDSFFFTPTVNAHPNPALLVAEHWPWSIDQHCAVWSIPCFLAVQIAFVAECKRMDVVLELKPLGWN